MGDRLRVTLVCDGCGARNYHTKKARAKVGERLTLKKFCPACGKHTLHRESK